MFCIETGKLVNYTTYKLLNPDTGEYVSVIPGFGGNINELVLNQNGIRYPIIDGIGPDEIIAGNVEYKSTKLIPFPNRVESGRYTFNGISYQLPINLDKHAIHGLIFNNGLEVIRINTNNQHASIKLKYDYDSNISGYPFKIRVLVNYSLLRGRGFVCNTSITNIDCVPIPVGDGWHPYFKTKGKIDKLQIRIPSKFRVQDAGLIPTGKLIPEEYPNAVTIGNKQYDTGFALEKKEGRASTEIYDPELNLKMVIWQETGKQKYNYLQIYTPPHRNSIAVEPMSCATNAFNNKMGLIVLEPGQSFTGSYGVYLK
jgi:aldose 1-epimerase